MLNGSKIDNMVVGGPAYDSQQLARGDVIIKVDGSVVNKDNILESIIGCDVPGSSVEICVAKGSAQEL